MDHSDKEKSEILGLFSEFKKEIGSGHGLNRIINDKILLIDGLNTYLRSWNADPSMNDDGLHVGGLSGFLKSIGYAIKLINPTRCIIIFDGDGGSLKRRKIYSEYKQHRKSKIRLNRSYEELSQVDLEEANKIKQLVRLVDYLQLLPVSILVLDNVEADDVIAYCTNEYFKNSLIYIMSSDKDFLQLVSARVKVWSPSKKKMYGPQEVLQDYNIHPNNFVLFKIMDGDTSDNIGGIKGVGIKTVIKYFPFLSESIERNVDYIINYSEQYKGKYKIYDRILECRDILKRNYQLMQLKETIMSSISQLNINDSLNRSKIPRLDRYRIGKLIAEDKMWNNIPNYHVWITQTFKSLDSMAKSQL